MYTYYTDVQAFVIGDLIRAVFADQFMRSKNLCRSDAITDYGRKSKQSETEMFAIVKCSQINWVHNCDTGTFEVSFIPSFFPAFLPSFNFFLPIFHFIHSIMQAFDPIFMLCLLSLFPVLITYLPYLPFLIFFHLFFPSFLPFLHFSLHTIICLFIYSHLLSHSFLFLFPLPFS